jgi:hypothetical protein
MSDEIVSSHGGRFVEGHQKLGGRGKRSASRARDLADSLGVDPLKWCLNLLKTGTYQATVIDETGKKSKVCTVASGSMLLDAAKCSLQYLYPKLSGISHTGADGEGPIQTETINLSVIMADPALCEAAQKLALAMADGKQDQPPQTTPIYGLLESGKQ